MKSSSSIMWKAVIQLALFVPLVWWVRRHPVNRLDVQITRRLQRHVSPVSTGVSRCLSVVWAWQSMTILACTLLLALWKTRLRSEAASFAGAMLAGTAGRKLLQRLIARPRPQPWLVWVAKQKSSKSFPSGHAITAMLGGGWLLILNHHLFKNRAGRRTTQAAFIMLLMGLAGPSRVYLGEHWTTDVIGGYLFGGTGLSLSFALCYWFNISRKLPAPIIAMLS